MLFWAASSQFTPPRRIQRIGIGVHRAGETGGFSHNSHQNMKLGFSNITFGLTLHWSELYLMGGCTIHRRFEYKSSLELPEEGNWSRITGWTVTHVLFSHLLLLRVLTWLIFAIRLTFGQNYTEVLESKANLMPRESCPTSKAPLTILCFIR